jgi:hypothetical protein
MASAVRSAAAITFAVFIWAGGAAAQTAGIDETVTNGTLIPQLAPSAAAESAIKTTVMEQKTKPATAEIAPAVGAPVPPSLELPALPEPASSAYGEDRLLKYAIVERDVVVIDPVIMRVIDVIHDWAKP